MSDPILSLEDPRLTAYALGELPPGERAAVEAFLAAHPQARLTVAETAAAARQLEAALAFETQADPDAQVWAAAAPPEPLAPYGRRRATLLQFPQLYYVIGGLAAACVAVLVALHDEKPHPVRYYRVAVTPPAASAPAGGAEAEDADSEPLEEPRAAAPSVREFAPEIAPLTDSLSASPRMPVARKLAIAPPHPQNPPREPEPQTQAVGVALRRASAGVSNAAVDVPRGTRPPVEAESVDATWPLPLSRRTVAVAGAERSLSDLDPALPAGEFAEMGLPQPTIGRAEQRAPAGTNGFVATADAPSAWVPFPDGDTGLAELQAALTAGHIPAPETIHIGAWLNAVANEAPARPDAATDEQGPVHAWIETAAAPWAPEHRLVRIGVRGRNAATAAPSGLAADAVAVQVAFDPTHVTAYRLIGYETAAAGNGVAPSGAPLAAGRTVTALFEIIPAIAKSAVGTAPMLTVHVQYRAVDGRAERLLLAATDSGRAFAAASAQFRFAAGVAAYGMVLQASPFRGSATLDRAIDWARTALPSQQRLATAQGDFVRLMELTTKLIR